MSGVLKYGPATYEICTDIIREDDNALFSDTVKHTGIQIGSKYLEREVGVPKLSLLQLLVALKYILMQIIKIKVWEINHGILENNGFRDCV